MDLNESIKKIEREELMYNNTISLLILILLLIMTIMFDLWWLSIITSIFIFYDIKTFYERIYFFTDLYLLFFFPMVASISGILNPHVAIVIMALLLLKVYK